ncbi:MAG: hypothetical protein IPM13_18425, partial [Phycisphaerales bacterium]|nr:hypothetical protein [Phycisphaerales bacterium]
MPGILLIRGLKGDLCLVGYRAAHAGETAVFEHLPVEESLLLEVLDPAFDRVLYRQRCMVPADHRGVFDLTSELRSMVVRVVDGDVPLQGIEVSVSPRNDGQQPTARDHGCSTDAATDEHGEARIFLADPRGQAVFVRTTAAAGSTTAVEIAPRPSGSDTAHTFDLAQGFRLRVRAGFDWVVPGENLEVHVEGEVAASKHMHFKHEVHACEDGVFVVRTGRAGVVRGRVVIVDATPDPAGGPWQELPRYIPFQATASDLGSRLPIVELQLPMRGVPGAEGPRRQLTLQ